MHRVERLVQHLEPSSTASSLEFRYTVDGSILTHAQREFYERNGFLLIRGLLEPSELDTYRRRFTALCTGEVERPATMTVMRDVSLRKKKGVKGEHNITKIQDFQDDPVMNEYCKHKRIVDYASAFTGPNVKSIHSMLIHKPPNVGKTGRHPFHQDLYYFPFRPADRIVAAWTAMERVDRNNGCLSVVPGSHLTGELLAHGYPDFEVNKAYHGIIGFEVPEDRVHLIMEAGDTVFFHPLLIHGSGANRTQGFRKAISCHYASADCYYIDVMGTVQEEIDAEVREMARIKFGLELTLAEAFAAKSRLVRGREGTL